jgi:hypothetical protein
MKYSKTADILYVQTETLAVKTRTIAPNPSISTISFYNQFVFTCQTSNTAGLNVSGFFIILYTKCSKLSRNSVERLLSKLPISVGLAAETAEYTA